MPQTTIDTIDANVASLKISLDKHSVTETTAEVEDSLEEAETTEKALGRISPLFTVQTTKYGGRGCFATNSIAKGTPLLTCRSPVGWSITHPFRKEVCTWCFAYQDGRTLKHRLHAKIYFCSEQCMSLFSAYDPEGVLTATLVAMEDMFVRCRGELNEDEVPLSSELESALEKKWSEVSEWERKVFAMKPSKRANHYPTVTEEDYVEIRYVISTLHTLYLAQKASPSAKYLHEMDTEDARVFEKSVFDTLQSSEREKVARYPYLLVSYVNIYKFVRLVVPECWLPFVTPQAVRDMIGRNLTNAFGIWLPTTQSGEGRELFGFGVYPSGSFFNHSCAFNVSKTRKDASYEFTADRDILPGEELCISYGIDKDDALQERRDALKEWFFVCGCTRCEEESR